MTWPLERRTPLKRTAMKRGPSARKKQTDTQLDAAREAVIARAGGACEIADPEACGTDEKHGGHHAHHVTRRPHTGGVHDPDAMLWVCWRSHSHLHAHPAEAYARGWLARSSPLAPPLT